jgi:hypothetical protein
MRIVSCGQPGVHCPLTLSKEGAAIGHTQVLAQTEGDRVQVVKSSSNSSSTIGDQLTMTVTT